MNLMQIKAKPINQENLYNDCTAYIVYNDCTEYIVYTFHQSLHQAILTSCNWKTYSVYYELYS